MKDYKQLDKCPISHSKKSITYFDFGMIPLVNNLNDTQSESLSCPTYPLILNYYPQSKLSMLSVAIDPKLLFDHYVYKSGTNKPYIEHCKNMYDYLSKFVTIRHDDTVVDIGGNDGTLLKTFVEKSKVKISPINIDPSENLSEISKNNGISTLTKRWTYGLASSPSFARQCKVITSTNVFQHVEDIGDFASGVHNALTNDGVWCLEFPYWKKDLETIQYDQVYHEHIYYYLLTPLNDLFSQKGLEIIDVSEQTIHCGSLRIISRIGRNRMPNPAVSKFIKEELIFDENFYTNWREKVKTHIFDSRTMLLDLKKSGKKIAAFGAAAKGCLFLNATNINHKTIDYIVDDTDTKQNKFMPGVGIQIVDRNRLIKDPPDYIVILAHNFADYITESLRPIYKGKFINMFPQPTIYE
jgi:cyclopropane fatty-acyl-phospholipid synthase-like methyltransferase